MITSTTLKNPALQDKIRHAIKGAANLNKNKKSIVVNRKGKTFLRCHYLTGSTAWHILGVSSGFGWLDSKGKDVTKVVNNSLVA